MKGYILPARTLEEEVEDEEEEEKEGRCSGEMAMSTICSRNERHLDR